MCVENSSEILGTLDQFDLVLAMILDVFFHPVDFATIYSTS